MCSVELLVCLVVWLKALKPVEKRSGHGGCHSRRRLGIASSMWAEQLDRSLRGTVVFGQVIPISFRTVFPDRSSVSLLQNLVSEGE